MKFLKIYYNLFPNRFFGKKKLVPLDNWTAFYYTGVTITFLVNVLYKRKTKEQVVEIIKKKVKDKKIKVIYCTTISKVVFESYFEHRHNIYSLSYPLVEKYLDIYLKDDEDLIKTMEFNDAIGRRIGRSSGSLEVF